MADLFSYRPLTDNEDSPGKSVNSDPRLTKLHTNPWALLIATIISIFLMEIVVMFILFEIKGLSTLQEAMLDATVLSVTVFPVLYFFFFRPLQANIRSRLQSEEERKKAQELDRLKSEFISTAAHELRTPLAAIMGYSELLLSEEKLVQRDATEFLAIIKEKSELLERIVDDLFDLSLIEAGKPICLDIEMQDIRPIINGIVNTIQTLNPNHEFRLNLPDDLPHLPVDRVKFFQIFENILSNSIKYSPVGDTILINGKTMGNDLLFQVQDHGKGMTTDQVDKAFDRFYRADASDTAVSGLGLGMAVTKGIVEGHGGKIWLKSTIGVGTTVNFTLPL